MPLVTTRDAARPGRRVVAIALTAVAVCGLTGCGESKLSSESALAALRSAGFRGLVIHRNTGETDYIEEIGRPWPPIPEFWEAVRVERFASNAKAKDGYKQGYSRASFRALVAHWRRHPKPCSDCGVVAWLKLPRGFELRKVLTFRICNVILFSYNARLDPRLTGKMNRAAALLRAKCH
jgi:hypothetical protein